MEKELTMFIYLGIAIVSILMLSSNCTVLYVKPNDRNTDCPGSPCQTFNDYIKNNDQQDYDSPTITMVLLEGNHYISENSIDFGIEFSESVEGREIFHMLGNGSNEHDVVVHNLDTGISDNIGVLTLERFTAFSSSISTPSSNYQATEVIIKNCTFIHSSLIFAKVDLVVKYSSFTGSSLTAISLYSSAVTFDGNVQFYNNYGIQGGALLLVGTVMQITNNTRLHFQDNRAKDTGGAIHVIFPETLIRARGYQSRCFYQLMDYSNESNYHLDFINNTANRGGDHIYGASLRSVCFATSGCACLSSYHIVHKFFFFKPGYRSSLSTVSAIPTTVCLCDEHSKPKCTILERSVQVYPGNQFILYVVLVGGDYGTTVGTIHASFLAQSNDNIVTDELSTAFFDSPAQQHQAITKNFECTELKFSVYSNKSNEFIILSPNEDILENYVLNSNESYDDHDNDNDRDYYDEYYYYVDSLRYIPLLIDITLLPCPPGFVLIGEHPGCDCHPVLTANAIKCVIHDLKGYHKWNSSTIWLQAKESDVLLSTHCPLHHCKTKTMTNIEKNPDAQCDFNRAGILCGSCKENYSLAIGSSNCIYCPNNNNLALLIFFAIAGVMLTFLIAALNLTVTQGTINSLVFYANIVWAYQGVLFPPSFGKELIIAWLNLDFGIETCFISGMNAYLKTWLQFIFPFYTATLFFIGVRYSSKLSKLLGSRSVPTLATILFLACSKLLRTIIACLQLSMYYTYSASTATSSTTFVWAIDGNYQFGKYPHIFLLLAAVICFLILWIPYTLLLVSRQWVRRVDHHGPLKHIARYKPFYDACFAPLKDKHHYWFGVLLIVQGLLLLVSSLTSNALPSVSVLLLLGVSFCLLCYVNSIRPYKSASVALLESSFLINFIMLAVGHLYFRSTNNIQGRSILLSLSISVAFIEFCGIIIWNLVPQKLKNCTRKSTRSNELEEDNIHILQEFPRDESEHSVSYQEISISELISQEETRADKCDTTESPLQ